MNFRANKLVALEQTLYNDLSSLDDDHYTCDRALFRLLYFWNENGVRAADVDKTVLDLYKFLEKKSLNFSSLDGYVGIYWFFKSLEDCGIYEDNVKLLPQLFQSIYYNLDKKGLKDYDPLYGNIASIHAIDLLGTDKKINSFIFHLRHDFQYKDIGIIFNELIDSRYSLSFAHGWPGIITLLSRLLPKADSTNCKWLREFIIQMASYIIELVYTRNKIENERLAWCFGHFGVALMLVEVNSTLGLNYNIEIDKSIEVILSYHAENAGLNQSEGYTDIGFCHGLTGLFYLSNHFAHLTNDHKLFTKADYWLNQILIEYFNNDDLRAVAFDKDRFHTYDSKTFMEGKLGLALTLQSLRKKSIIPWHNLIMISRLNE